jgi:hypothetical protein
VHPGAVDGAAEQLLEGEQPVAVVEVQAAYLYHGDAGRQAVTQAVVSCLEMVFSRLKTAA